MAVERFEAMWFLLNQYNFKIDLSRFNDLVCGICKKLLNEAMQSPCSCKFCRRCIEQYLMNSNGICPGTTTQCNTTTLDLSDDVIIDTTANKRISLLKVKCPFDLCQYEDKLINMETHINHCDKKSSQPQPDMSLENLELINHIQIDEIIHLKLLIESIDNLRNENKVLVSEINSIKELQYSTNQLQQQIDVLNLKVDLIITNQKALCKKLDVVFQEKKINTQSMDDQDVIKKSNKLKIKKDSVKSQTNSGEIIWKIDNFANTKKNLIHGKERWLDSAEFYTYPSRLKMQIRLWIGEQNVDILIKMLPDENDKYIQWPIKCEVTVEIINPDNSKMPISETKIIECQATSFTSKSYFHFPNSSVNKYVLKNDTLTVKCSAKDISLYKQK